MAVRLWALLGVALLLGGCASLWGDKAGAEAQAAGPPLLVLQVEAPDDIKPLLEADLDLARLPVLARGKTLPQRELDRLVAAAPQQVHALLETEGYFQSEVQVEQVEQVEQPAAAPPTVLVRVQPGPRAQVRELRIDVQGPLAAATERNEPYARDAQQALRHNWALPPGAPFRNPLWSAAKRSALAQLRAQGFANADWLSTVARVDAQTQAVTLELVVDSGPLFRTGELRVRGLERQSEASVRNLANLRPGTPATEKTLLDIQERLQKSGLFDSATVQLDARAEDPAAAPVTIRLSEQKLQEATVGIGVSSDVGVRGTLDHVHRRAFGNAATARNHFELGTVRQAWEGELSSHTLPGLHRNLLGGAAERIESENDVVTSARLRVGRAQETPRIDRLAFVEVERSLRQSDVLNQKSDAITANYHGIWRAVDNVLLPTDGRVASFQVGLGQARSDPGGSGPLLRLYSRANVFRPIGRNWFGQVRLELGQVFSRSDVVPPDTMLFRAGGEASVRGYEYRSLTPTVNGVQSSGKVLFTTSVELARPILARLPALWGAVFVDAGRAADNWGALKPAVGAGVGLRYRSPIGPLSLDLAYGEEVRRYRLHLSVGVTF